MLMIGAFSARGQLVAYDDAGNYVVSANWTNGANQGFGFTPWMIVTNGPDFHSTYINAGTNPLFVIATVTNVLGTNYADVWGIFANGTNDINNTVAYRGFANALGTNTFKLQWGSRGAGVTTTVNAGVVNGMCGFSLRNGNATNSVSDYQTGARFYLYFRDGFAPFSLNVLDGNGVHSFTNTSFSDLGRQNITNAVQAEVTVANDGNHYHLVLKDCVQGRTLVTYDSLLAGSGTIDSAALFCNETTGDQVYNKMQIAVPQIPPNISNLQPADGSIYLNAGATTLSFEVDSFNSTVSNNAVTVLLNGIAQSLSFNTPNTTNQLQVTVNATLAPDLFYDWTIIAQDSTGLASTNSYTFNTFLASDIYIDAYDYNFNNGQFINANTPANAYINLFGTNGVDYLISDLTGVNNTAGYRPGDLPQILPLAVDATGDPIDHANLRANSYTAYNIGFTDTGNWENYTRVISPNTNYSIYARAASAGGGQFEIERLANPTATSSNQPLAAIGRVNVPITGGSKVYTGQLQPLTDAYGNTVVLPLAGTTTIRCTAIASRVYNLEYLLLVAVTNASGTLNPYLAVASPAPNAIGAGLATPLSFTLAHRQTTVLTNSIKFFTNGVQATPLTITSNAAGVAVSFNPTANRAPNSNYTVMVTFTNSANAAMTNVWTFTTGTAGGLNGNGVWSGAAGPADMNWSTATNWTGGTPGPGFTGSFASPGATTNVATNNVVSTNSTILGLFYNTNNSGYHTTLIQDGITLTVTNPTTSVTAVMQVGGTTGGDNSFNKPVTNTITGPNGTLMIGGNTPAAGANSLNFQVRQCANPPAAEQVVLDMSGLGTMVAYVGKFYLAQGGSGSFQSNVSARVNLARTNVITCLRAANAGTFEVGDSSGGAITLPGSTLNFGITNAVFADTVRFGKQKATNNLVRFNPDFVALNPALFIRGTNGLNSRVANFTIGDADTETAFLPVYSSANLDFSAGRVDGLVSVLVIGRGSTAAADTGFAQGTLTLKSGTLDVSSLQVGVQRAVNTATASGIVQINGTATLISTNIILAATNAGANASLVSGSLNITNGTVRGTITAGGGVSTVNISAGTLVVSNSAGTAATPLTALNLVNASLHLKADGAATAAPVVATSVAASGTVITIDSVANVTGTQTVHLVGYSGSNPFAGFSLAPLPEGYTGTLVNNSGVVDLTIAPSALPPSPTIGNIRITGNQIIISGTNNHGAGGTYSIITSTNVLAPRSNWTLLTNGTFDGNGNFSSTNATGTNTVRFYQLQVP